jgi:hypothetical protein
MRRFDVFGALATEVGIAEIVGKNDDDVRGAGLGEERDGESCG